MPGSYTPASPTGVRDEDQDDETDMKASEAGIKALPAHLFYFMGMKFPLSLLRDCFGCAADQAVRAIAMLLVL